MEDQRKTYEPAERELELSDLIEEVLRRIWFVIVLAVICGAAAVLYKYTKDKAAAEAGASVSINIKYLIVGLILGIVIAALLIILYVILRKTVQTASELSATYGLYVFGQIDVYEKKNALVTLWRKILNRQPKIPADEQLKLTEVQISSFCKKRGISCLLLAGDIEGLCEEPCIKELSASLSADGIQTAVISPVISDPKALLALAGYEQIILVERLKRSREDSVAKMIATCARQEIEIAGAVAIN